MSISVGLSVIENDVEGEDVEDVEHVEDAVEPKATEYNRIKKSRAEQDIKIVTPYL